MLPDPLAVFSEKILKAVALEGPKQGEDLVTFIEETIAPRYSREFIRNILWGLIADRRLNVTDGVISLAVPETPKVEFDPRCNSEGSCGHGHSGDPL